MLKKVWRQEKKRLIQSGILFSLGMFLGILLGNYVNITPKQYYRPGQGAVWYNLALNNMGAALLIAGTGFLFSIPTIIMLLFNARAVKQREKIPWGKEARQSAALFAVVMAMLIAASLIEAHITPVIMDWTR
ncbi:hypothetical protein GCM10008915_21190 [Bifidobacterium pullorum subsp. gallinarum]